MKIVHVYIGGNTKQWYKSQVKNIISSHELADQVYIYDHL